MVRYLSAVMVVALAFVGGAAGDGVFSKTESGSPKIQGIDAIAFGPDGALLIGDSKGAQIVAIDTKDTKATKSTVKVIEKFNEKVADKLGTTASKIEITGLAVNPASGTTYVIVKNAGKSVLITVNGEGKIGEFTFDKVNHVVVPLPKSTTLITDLAFAKDRILVGGVDKEAFGSKVLTIKTPLDPSKQATGFATETYHVAHGKWETKAPMTTLISMEQKGKQYVVGAFACTPIVRYPLDDVKEGAKVKGTSVIELGHGNRPQGMFQYTKDGKSYLLVVNRRHDRFHSQTPVGPSPFWVAKVDMSVFDETEKVNQKAEWRVEKMTATPKKGGSHASVAEAYHGTRYAARLNDTQAAVIQEDGKSGITFAVRELP